MSRMRAIKNVRSLKVGEKYWAAYAGEYTEADGKKYFLDNPGAETIASLYNLKTSKLQFEFFCFAYLWKLRDVMNYAQEDEYELALDRYMKLQDKFQAPWYSQAKHVLPIESPRMFPFTDRGDLDLEEMKKVFDKYVDCAFIIYSAPLHDDPEWARYSDMLTPLKSAKA